VALKSFCQPSIAPNPCEEPLDDPAPRVNGEADLIGVLAHDLDRDQGGLGDLLSGVPAVGEDPVDEQEDAARSPQKRSAAVASLMFAGRGSRTRPRPSVSTSARRLLCVGQIGLVSGDNAAMLSSISWRPDGESKLVQEAPWNHGGRQ
jgi:hypothetical protein